MRTASFPHAFRIMVAGLLAVAIVGFAPTAAAEPGQCLTDTNWPHEIYQTVWYGNPPNFVHIIGESALNCDYLGFNALAFIWELIDNNGGHIPLP